VEVPAVLADFIAGRFLNQDRCHPTEPKIGSEFARPRKVVEDGDTVIPSSCCVWIILIPPHAFAEGAMRLEIVKHWCLATDETKEFARHAALHPVQAESSA
jgi:hypothetical protein